MRNFLKHFPWELFLLIIVISIVVQFFRDVGANANVPTFEPLDAYVTQQEYNQMLQLVLTMSTIIRTIDSEWTAMEIRVIELESLHDIQ